MLVFKSSFFCCPGTTPGPGDDNYLAVMLTSVDSTITHNFGRYPLVEVLSITVANLADAFTFDGFTTDANAGTFTFTEIPDSDYTINYLNTNEIQFTQPTLQSVYVLLRA